MQYIYNIFMHLYIYIYYTYIYIHSHANFVLRRRFVAARSRVQVPLLDMKRYTKLLAGASWIAEYGDPDSADWENFLHRFSPYHNLDAARASEYPATLFTTSTRDDRVHPGHARKMAKRMLDMGVTSVNYWENVEGGHGGASTNEQRAKMWALTYQFLSQSLK